MRAADRGDTGVVMRGALRRVSEDDVTAAAQLLVELLLEGFTQQVKSKRVEAGVGEGQDASDNAAHEVSQRRVHLAGAKRREVTQLTNDSRTLFRYKVLISTCE